MFGMLGPKAASQPTTFPPLTLVSAVMLESDRVQRRMNISEVFRQIKSVKVEVVQRNRICDLQAEYVGETKQPSSNASSASTPRAMKAHFILPLVFAKW